MKHVSFHQDALAEIGEAADFYEARETGLGRRFVDVVDGCVARLSSRAYVPFIPQLKALGVKVTPVSAGPGRWPWRVIFVEDDERIVIVAVAHNRRRESYWRSRLGDIEEP